MISSGGGGTCFSSFADFVAFDLDSLGFAADFRAAFFPAGSGAASDFDDAGGDDFAAFFRATHTLPEQSIVEMIPVSP